MEGMFFQIAIYLGAAVVAVPLASRLGLGSVLGYLAAGLLIGPVLGLVGTETQELQHVAEFGVVMMLFLIGLELDPRTLWDMRDKLLGLGTAQIVVTTILIAAGAALLGQATKPAIAIGLIFALSSTAIVLQTLSERGLMRTQGGRSTFSVLLAQDIAVIPMLVLLPLLATAPVPSFNPDGSISRAQNEDLADHSEHALSLVEGLPGWGATLVTLGMIAAVILAGRYLVNPIFHYIHHSRLREMYTALALLIVVGIAVLMGLVGLSPALGTFLAGVVLANSEFRHELESDIEPFKGLLLGLFFITVGAGLDVAGFFAAPVTLIGLTLGIMVIKGLVLYLLARVFQLRGRHKWLFTLGLAQAGEFGLLLISFSAQQHVLPGPLADQLLTVTALSMLLTPLFFLAYEFLSKRVATPEAAEADEIDSQGPVIIAGVGRFGQAVNRMVQMSGFNTVVLDRDLATIQLLRRFGYKGFFGDPTRPSLLNAAGLKEAETLVVALDDRDAAVQLVAHAKRERPDLFVVARARDRVHAYALLEAGADKVVRELFDSSLRAGRYVLENAGLSEFEAATLEKTYFDYDRAALRDLAPLWKRGVPLEQNADYMARSQELHTELEAALLSRFEEEHDDEGAV
ncbi:putative Glutathione-regulated potassium-efflux system protein KefB [Candidatus Rhodobacter oscarellae]|uniref:Putative Glutathione-regulated potassium-efflux system protein KefB n=1 Tax=Candidatus Rhodobacter oscarellae TaxID=1675527 RepID=A0A0J9E984_9RHOB|nr:monovalent cation:proton antiporter-2 (CPA2) family protein [Candidatus Rhodobacter lobularis]KMW58229.1 putative Glutathione-regulated potassium-efflux system protein KefB [Candidatus Rhodobacter lobularis]